MLRGRSDSDYRKYNYGHAMRAFSSSTPVSGNSPVLRDRIKSITRKKNGCFRALLFYAYNSTITVSSDLYPKRASSRLRVLKIMLPRVCSRVNLKRPARLAWPYGRYLQAAASQQAFLEPLGSHPGISCLSLNRPQSKNAISTTLLQVNSPSSVIPYID